VARECAVLEVRSDSREASQFSEVETILVSDKSPWVEFRVRGTYLAARRKSKELKTVSDCDRLPDGTFWQRWDLGEGLSRDRRMGLHELVLRVPRGVTLRCYIVPHRIMTVGDILVMIKDCGRELRRSVQWQSPAASPVRTWVGRSVIVDELTPSSAIREISEELKAAASLRRRPPLEFSVQGRLSPAPELALITRWADRRSVYLSRLIGRLESEVALLHAELGRGHPAKRSQEIRKDLDLNSALVLEAKASRARVLAMRRREEAMTTYHAGPMSQRDYRMRRIMRCFAPPRERSQSSLNTEAWSKVPPTSINRLFEVWGGVWLIMKFRGMGFEVELADPHGADFVTQCCWHLRRGDIAIHIDYEPRPELLSLDTVPPLGERSVPAADWSISHIDGATPSRYFGTEARCSPDYLITLEGPSGRVLAVGDACVADARYQGLRGKETKLEIVSKYRRSIFWSNGGDVYPCCPLGAFVVLPGPTATWSGMEQRAAKMDIWAFCPQPCQTDPDAERRFEAFANHLIDAVT